MQPARKILMPYKQQNGISIHSAIISGGIEKFAQDLYKNIPGIIPLEITDDDRTHRRVKSKMAAAIAEHSPDMVLSNYDESVYTVYPMKLGIPVSLIIHAPASANVRYLQSIIIIKKFIEMGGHVYFVSANQQRIFDGVSRRINGHELENLKGYVNPAFCSGLEAPDSEIEYPCLTIGRNEALKDPFWIHRKLKNTPDLKTTVLTNTGFHLSFDVHKDYYESNLHWEIPRETIRGGSHVENMDKLSKAGCYVSTCPYESWGITALEALARGIPLVLCGTSQGHSSATIAADPSHIHIIKKSMNEKKFGDLVRELNQISWNERATISHLTKQKHSIQNWKSHIEALVSDRLGSKISTNSPKTSSWFN